MTDLAQAHVLGLDALGTAGTTAYNIGNGSGYSVKEVIEVAEEVTGKKIKSVAGQAARRPGGAGGEFGQDHRANWAGSRSFLTEDDNRNCLELAQQSSKRLRRRSDV